MALDIEDFRRRRRQREQQQRQRQAKRRRTLFIGAGAGVLLLILIGIILLIAGNTPPEDPTVSTPTETQTSTETSAPPPDTVIHFAMAGDLNINDTTVGAGGAAYDYTDAFMDVAHLLADADITAVNLEGNLLGAPYGSDTVSAPQTMMEALSAAGVDLVQLANSYSINAGIAGLNDTIQGVRSAGMIPLGVYTDREEYEKHGGFTIVNVKGLRVAFVAFTKGMDGMALPAGSEHCVNVLYTDYDSTYQDVDTEGINAVLQRVSAQSPDVTIALLHWGSEFNNTISSSQKKICQLMLDGGVDAVIGTHSHYVQQMTLDPETGTFVAYSLGDFFSDAQQPGSEYSVILDLEITRDNTTGETSITNYSYTPIFSVVEEGKDAKVLRIHQAMRAYEAAYLERVTQKTYEAMAYALQRIEARVTGE